MNDWGFLKELLKKANFNWLILSFAITGWILYFITSRESVIIFGIAIGCSVYCLISFCVVVFNQCKEWVKKLKNRREKKKEEKRRKEWCEKYITRMYDGLSERIKEKLYDVYLYSDKDTFEENTFNIKKSDWVFVSSVAAADAVNNINFHPITFTHYHDSVTIHIDPFLCEFIRKDIDEKGYGQNNIKKQTEKIYDNK